MGFQGSRSVFYRSQVGFSWFQDGLSQFQMGFMVIHVSRSFFWFQVHYYGFSRFQVVFLVPGPLSRFFKVSGCFFIVPGRFLWFFKVPGWFFIVPSGFSSFWRFQVGFEGISWSQVGFYSFRPVFHGFLWFFMFFYGSRSGFHDLRWFFIAFNGSRLVYIRAELSEVRRWEHPKRYSLDLYLSPKIPLGLASL